MKRSIGGASRAFGALRQPIFEDLDLSITTKRYIYRACVLPVLLYGSECWVPLKRDLIMGLPRTEWIGGGGGVLLSVSIATVR